MHFLKFEKRIFISIVLLLTLLLSTVVVSDVGESAGDNQLDYDLRNLGEALRNSIPNFDSMSELEKGKIAYTEYLRLLEGQNAGVSNYQVDRLWDLLSRSTNRETLTCSAHTANLISIFKGMGIQSIGKIEARYDSILPDIPAALIDPNNPHGAVILQDNDGQFYVFDAWAHATDRDSWSPFDNLYGEGSTSSYNGMPAGIWRDTMGNSGFEETEILEADRLRDTEIVSGSINPRTYAEIALQNLETSNIYSNIPSDNDSSAGNNGKTDVGTGTDTGTDTKQTEKNEAISYWSAADSNPLARSNAPENFDSDIVYSDEAFVFYADLGMVNDKLSVISTYCYGERPIYLYNERNILKSFSGLANGINHPSELESYLVFFDDDWFNTIYPEYNSIGSVKQ